MTIPRAVVALLLLCALGGCSDDGDQVETKGALTDDQLATALLEPGTVVAEWTVREPAEWHKERSSLSALPDSCDALAVVPLPDVEPVSWGRIVLHREVPGSRMGDIIYFEVMSFGGDAADRTFRALKHAVTDCAGGFTLELPTHTIDVDEVALGPSPGLGDESATVVLKAAQVMSGNVALKDCKKTITLVRLGNDLIWQDTRFFCEVPADPDMGPSATLPLQVAQRQLTRLAQAHGVEG